MSGRDAAAILASTTFGGRINKKLLKPLQESRKAYVLTRNAAQAMSSTRTIWTVKGDEDPAHEWMDLGFTMAELSGSEVTSRQLNGAAFCRVTVVRH